MQQELILRSEAMKIVNAGRPFSLAFVTADRRRGTGGYWLQVKDYMKLRDDLPADARPRGYVKKHERKRESNNFSNKTFRIFNPANKAAHPITVHFRLIQNINGKQIING